jgi:uncharacterized protein YoxC
MEIIAIAAAVIAITFIVLVGFMIPALIEIRKAAVSVRMYMTDVESQLKPVLKELGELTVNMRVMTDAISSRTGEVKAFMEALGDTGRNISKINVVADEAVSFLCKSSMWIKGLQAASRYAVERILQKGGN